MTEIVRTPNGETIRAVRSVPTTWIYTPDGFAVQAVRVVSAAVSPEDVYSSAGYAVRPVRLVGADGLPAAGTTPVTIRPEKAYTPDGHQIIPVRILTLGEVDRSADGFPVEAVWLTDASGTPLATAQASFDFMAGTMPGGAVLTRASTGWAFSSLSVLTSYANDIARFAYDPAVWTPLNLGSQLVGFIDFEDNSKITQSGGLISQIIDSANPANIFSQAVGAAQPKLWISPITGRQVAQFDSIDDNLACTPCPPTYPLSGPTEWWAVVTQELFDATARYAFGIGSGAGGLTQVIGRIQTPNNAMRLSAGDGTTAFSAISTIVTGSSVLRGLWTGTAMTAFNNGVAGAPLSIVQISAATRARIGANVSNTVGSFWSGSVSAIVIINGNLSPANVTNMQNWANARLNPAISNLRGLWNEPAAINQNRNSTAVGAIPGTIGTAPTNWALSGSVNGLVRTIIGTGTEDGIAYIDIRYVGTPTATSTLQLGAYETNSFIVATQGQTWVGSVFARLVAGSLDGFNANKLQLQFREFDSGAALLNQAVISSLPVTAAPLRQQRYDITYTTLSALTAAVNVRLIAGYQINTPLDFTLRIGLPQVVLAASLGSVIVAPNAVTTRAVDVLTLTVPNGSYDVDLYRENGVQRVAGVVVSGGSYVVPTSASPLRQVIFRTPL